MKLINHIWSMQFPTESYSSVERQVLQANDILRAEGDTNNYYLVGFLLLLQKEGVLVKLNSLKSGFVREELRRRVAALKKEQHSLIKALYHVFESFINKVEDRTLYQILEIIDSIDREHLESYFGDLIESMVSRISRFQGRMGGEVSQPTELTEFICALADLPQGASVYNPFAGLASFGVHLDLGIQYFGQELNQMTWAIGLLRIIANNKEPQSDFVVGDSVKEWNPYSKKYDLIVANPPFNMRISRHISASGSSETAEDFFLYRAMADLSDRGKAIVVLPNSFLYSNAGNRKAIRRFLVMEDQLEMVISFPGGLLANTNIPFSVLVISNAKKYNRKVLFVDAESYVKEISRKDRRIDVQNLLSGIANLSNPETKLIAGEEIIDNDFNLTVTRFFVEDLPEIQLGETIKLGEILKVVRGTRIKERHIGKFVRIRDLKNDRLNFELDAEEVESTDVPMSTIKLEKSALLLATRWRTLKPTYFEYKGEPIYVSSDVVACEINEQLVDRAYLVNELYSDYVADQLNKYRTGTTIPYISKQDLLQVKIEHPSLEEQRAKIRGVKESLGKLQRLEVERNALAHGISEKVYQDFATIKHSMGKPLLNLNSGVRNIEAALTKLNKDWESFVISERADFTLRDAVNSLHANLKLLSNLLKNNEKELEVSNYSFSQVNAVKFLKQYVKDLQNAEDGKYNILLVVSADIKSEFKNGVLIKANEELLKIALNNIVENAQEHAFTQTGKEYKLEFRLGLLFEKTNAFVRFEVANNGEPFPKNFNLAKLIRKGSIAGPTGKTGIGGHDISKIVKWHEGRLDLITDAEGTDFYSTIYEILIPIHANNGNDE